MHDPIAKIQHISRIIGQACRIYVAWHEALPIASAVVLLGSNADYTMGAMDKEQAAPVCANDLIQKLAIEDACLASYRYYHMGESGALVGISEFKERLGAQAYTYETYRLERFSVSKLDKALRSVIKDAIGFKEPY